MIEDFPIGDSLHLIDLGITKRLLFGWKNGTFGKKVVKWSASTINEITAYLESCRKPKEIHRTIRGLQDLSHWKGTEYRTFLLYISIVVLKKHLSPTLYNHFLLYFCAITILSSDYYIQSYLEIAEQAIEMFLDRFGKLYSIHYVFSNMHNLSHLIDDIKRFGPLSKFSSYPFENKLFQLKQMIRTGRKPLEQIARRIIESESEILKKVKNTQQPNVILNKSTNKYPQNLTNLFLNKNYSVYKHFTFSDFVIDDSEENRWILTDKAEIVRTEFFVDCENTVWIYGRKLTSIHNFFELPFPSSVLNIYVTDLELDSPKLHNSNILKAKMFKLKEHTNYESDSEDDSNEQIKYIFIPIIHTLQKDK